MLNPWKKGGNKDHTSCFWLKVESGRLFVLGFLCYCMFLQRGQDYTAGEGRVQLDLCPSWALLSSCVDFCVCEKIEDKWNEFAVLDNGCAVLLGNPEAKNGTGHFVLTNHLRWLHRLRLWGEVDGTHYLSYAQSEQISASDSFATLDFLHSLVLAISFRLVARLTCTHVSSLPSNQGLVGGELFLYKWFGIMRYWLDSECTVLNAFITR